MDNHGCDHFMVNGLFNFHSNSEAGNYYCHHFTHVETKAQRYKLTCPGMYSEKAVWLETKSKQPVSGIPILPCVWELAVDSWRELLSTAASVHLRPVRKTVLAWLCPWEADGWESQGTVSPRDKQYRLYFCRFPLQLMQTGDGVSGDGWEPGCTNLSLWPIGFIYSTQNPEQLFSSISPRFYHYFLVRGR